MRRWNAALLQGAPSEGEAGFGMVDKGALDGDGLLDLLEAVEGRDGLYSFPLFKEEFCDALVQESQRLTRHVNPELARRLNPSSGALVPALDDMSLGWLADLLLGQVVSPIADAVFHEDLLAQQLDWRFGYVVGYAEEAALAVQRSSLVSHTDDAEITLNVSLGQEFEGGELAFHGVRGTAELNQAGPYPEERWTPKKGWACIHLGRHLHEVKRVRGPGQRFQLILWTRSSGARGFQCPCCWMNRRVPFQTEAGCVCGPAWN